MTLQEIMEHELGAMVHLSSDAAVAGPQLSALYILMANVNVDMHINTNTIRLDGRWTSKGQRGMSRELAADIASITGKIVFYAGKVGNVFSLESLCVSTCVPEEVFETVEGCC